MTDNDVGIASIIRLSFAGEVERDTTELFVDLLLKKSPPIVADNTTNLVHSHHIIFL